MKKTRPKYVTSLIDLISSLNLPLLKSLRLVNVRGRLKEDAEVIENAQSRGFFLEFDYHNGQALH